MGGYGVEDGTKYWKVKNSWGPGWGDEGYVKILRGKDGGGECGIKLGASYPVVSPEFAKYVAKFGKKYTEDETSARFEAFMSTSAYIKVENAKNHSYQLDLNEFSDMPAAEFSKTRFGLKRPEGGLWSGLQLLGTHQYSGNSLPESVDWTLRGAVTPVKNQGGCGSCWTFSATGALEGAWQIAAGELVPLSEQQLVDCVNGGGGCSGGLMDMAFKYEKDHDVCTEASYQYEGQNGACRAAGCEAGIPRGDVVGYHDVNQDEESLMEAVAQQPVSIAIEADQWAFQSYKSGVLTWGCGTSLDHGVLLVGYGVEDGTKYWKVKNSWGPGWGDEGYVKILRGKDGGGECGIKLEASYPVVSPEFANYAAKFGKKYTEDEKSGRFEAFKSTSAYIKAENAKNHSYQLELNEFSDMPATEFSKTRFGLKRPEGGLWSGLQLLGTHQYSGNSLPESVDWTLRGAVTPVKNQGGCGSCWTFSATGALEGAWQIAAGELTPLSEQQLVDC